MTISSAGIDDTKPIEGTPTTQSVRDNFTEIKAQFDNAQTDISTNATDISTNATNHTNHLADTTDAHDASAISNTPSGSIIATDVQAAINELDTEKANLAGDNGYTGTAQYATGEGIVFTGDAITAANTLDDYEKGTFTAELKGSTSSATIPATLTGYYTKIGDLIHVSIYFINVDTTGAIGGMVVSGLPFLSHATARSSGSVITYGLSIPNLYLGITGNTSSTIISFESPADNAAWSSPTITAGTTKYMMLSYTYKAQ